MSVTPEGQEAECIAGSETFKRRNLMNRLRSEAVLALKLLQFYGNKT
jgi:hypothetical protein